MTREARRLKVVPPWPERTYEATITYTDTVRLPFTVLDEPDLDPRAEAQVLGTLHFGHSGTSRITVTDLREVTDVEQREPDATGADRA